MYGDPFDGVDQRIEARIAGVNAGFQEVEIVPAFHGKAFCQQIVFRQIQVDESKGASCAISFYRLRLNQLSRQMVRFVQKKKADLRDMGSGCDMDLIIIFFGGEVVSAAEVVKLGVDLFKIPWI